MLLRNRGKHLIPEILIRNSFSSTSIQEEDNINSNLLTVAPPQNHNTDGLAIKLNHLKEKSARYNSHRNFLSKCIQENLVAMGLGITLEPAIGNFDQEFVDKSYTNLKQFCIGLMKQIVAYCDKTEQKTQKNITETETILQQQLKKEDYKKIKNTITSNETATTKLLERHKFKKFTSLKYKPKSAVRTVVNNNEGGRTTQEQPRPTKPSYAQALKSNTNTF